MSHRIAELTAPEAAERLATGACAVPVARSVPPATSMLLSILIVVAAGRVRVTPAGIVIPPELPMIGVQPAGSQASCAELVRVPAIWSDWRSE